MAEETADNEQKTYRFTVNLNPVRYAKRFGVEIPDDSADTGLTGDAEKSETPSDERKQPSNASVEKTDDEPSEGEGRAHDGADGLFEQDAEDSEPTTSCQLPTTSYQLPTTNSPVIAEDANVNYGKRMSGTMAGQCAATLAQCKAKNPMTCRFHGAKVIAQDIENFLRQQGVNGQVMVELQNVTKQGKKELLSAQVEIVGTKKEEKLVTKAMQAFANLPGVDSVEDGDYAGKRIYTGFDIDILDPQAQARWGAAQAAQATPAQQPAPQPSTPAPAPQPTPAPQPQPQPQQQPQQQPQPQPQQQQPQPTQPAPQPAPQPAQTIELPANAAPLHPIAPPKPQAAVVPDFTQQDLDDLTAGRDRLEPALRLLNGHVGDTNYITNSGRFPGLDSVSQDTAFFQRLDDLTQNKDAQVAAAAQTLKTVADAIAASRAAGWATKPGMMLDDAATFLSKLPSVQDIPEPPKSEEEKREPDVNMAKALKNATDPKAPKSAADELIAAHDLMTDMENDVESFDDSLKNEKDQDNKAWLKAAVDALDAAYGAAKKQYDDAKAAIDSWMATQSTAAESFGYNEARNYYKSRGLKIPLGLETMEDHAEQKETAAEKVVANAFKNRKGWSTHQERLDRIEQLRKNLRLLWKHIHIYHGGTTHCDSSLEKDGAVRANVNDRDYVGAMRNAFGVKQSTRIKAQDMQLYCFLSVEDNPRKCTDSYARSRARIIEFNPDKAIGGLLFSRGCGYWNGGPTTAMNLFNRINFTDLAYEGSIAPTFRPESAEDDFTGMTPKQMFAKMFGGEGTMEFHLVNGGSFEQENIARIFYESGHPLSNGAANEAKKNNVPVVAF